MAMETLQEVGSIIRSHHERYVGTGYPDGLKAQDIPIAARIIAVVNDYDAVKIGTLTAEKLSELKARRYVEERSGSWYDANVVQQFFAVLNEIGEKDTNQLWTLQSHELERGMVLAKDLVAKDGILLLSKGFVLDERMIKKIQMFERLVNIVLKIEICAKRYLSRSLSNWPPLDWQSHTGGTGWRRAHNFAVCRLYRREFAWASNALSFHGLRSCFAWGQPLLRKPRRRCSGEFCCTRRQASRRRAEVSRYCRTTRRR